MPVVKLLVKANDKGTFSIPIQHCMDKPTAEKVMQQFKKENPGYKFFIAYGDN